MMDPYIVTAMAYYTIGGVLLYVAMKVIMSHPVNRVFIFGEYLTAEGVKLVIRHWPLVSLFGLFIFACAVDHHLHWMAGDGHGNVLLMFMGWVEAGISVITAVVVLVIAFRRSVRRWPKD